MAWWDSGVWDSDVYSEMAQAPAPLVVLGLNLTSNNVTSSPGTGVVTFTGNVPLVTGFEPAAPHPLVWLGLNLSHTSTVVTPSTGIVTFTGNVPTVTWGNLPPHPLVWLGLNLQNNDPYLVAPSSGVVTFTGNQPVILGFDQTATPTTGEVTFTGNVPTVRSDLFTTPNTGVVTFTGNQPVVTWQTTQQAVDHSIPAAWSADLGYVARYAYLPLGVPQWTRPSVETYEYQPSTGVITFTGNIPSVFTDIIVSPGTGEVEFNGGQPFVDLPTVVSPTTGVITFTGNIPDVDLEAFATPGTGVVTFVGNTPFVGLPVAVTPGTGEMIFVGGQPIVDTQEQIIRASTGLMSFFGNQPTYDGAIPTDQIRRGGGGKVLPKPSKPPKPKFVGDEEEEKLPSLIEELIEETGVEAGLIAKLDSDGKKSDNRPRDLDDDEILLLLS